MMSETPKWTAIDETKLRAAIQALGEYVSATIEGATVDLRKVIVSKPVRQELPSNGTGRVACAYPLVPQGEALFHQFGVSYEEFEAGPGNYTTAIIEWPDGRLESVPAEHVQFVVVMPIPAAPLCPLCNGCGLLGVGE